MEQSDDTKRGKLFDSFATSSSGSFTNPVEEHLAPGTLIDGRYQIESILGEGGCGCVYKAKHVALQKYCALKTLNPVNVTENTMLRLHKEARAAGLLEHDNLVRATDFGSIDDTRPFLVMDYVEGPTLAEYLKQRGTMSVESAVSLFVPICWGLGYAHHQGVIHRDIKPSNILLAKADNDLGFVPKVSDFGIAKLEIGSDNSLTATGEIFGTPLYMSPEQCLGTGVDQRSDIYSLGCVLFEALTGSPPFVGKGPMELLMKHTTESPPSLKEASLGREFPPALETILANMLNKEPRDRYQKLDDTIKDLLALRRGKELTPLKRSTDSPASKTALIVLACVMATMIVGFVAYYLGTKNAATVSQANADLENAKDATGEHSPFLSKTKGDKIEFQFPADVDFGTLHYWDSAPHELTVHCKGTVEVPKSAKLIFYGKDTIANQPAMWTRFRDDDLTGIRMDLNEFLPTIDSREHIVDANLRAILPKEHLRLLALPIISFTKQTWSLLGIMPNLRWLWLNTCTLDDAPIHGRDLVRLNNLSNLRVLSLDQIFDVRPLLSALAKSTELVRLSIGCVTLEPRDGTLLARIPNLKTLRIRRSAITDSAFFDELSKSPKLEDLCLNEMTAVDPSIAGKLSKFKHLKRLAFDSGQHDLRKNLRIPGCEIIELGARDDEDGVLLNSLRSDARKGDRDSEKVLKTADSIIAKLTQETPIEQGQGPELSESASRKAMEPERPPHHESVSWFDYFSENPDTKKL